MHIAILNTNTDDSDFAQAQTPDGRKWEKLLHAKRPDWRFSVFSAKDGHFPKNEDTFDGWIIGSSPASVHDDAQWISDLLELIRRIASRRTPMLGADFGHHAIALALGGTVTPNPDGWHFGSSEVVLTAPPPWMPAARIWQYSSYHAQVTELPQTARCIMSHKGCPIGGFVIGDHIFTTQHQPELADKLMKDIVEHLERTDPSDTVRQARHSLLRGDDNWIFANWISAFFERDFDPNKD